MINLKDLCNEIIKGTALAIIVSIFAFIWSYYCKSDEQKLEYNAFKSECDMRLNVIKVNIDRNSNYPEAINGIIVDIDESRFGSYGLWGKYKDEPFRLLALKIGCLSKLPTRDNIGNIYSEIITFESEIKALRHGSLNADKKRATLVKLINSVSLSIGNLKYMEYDGYKWGPAIGYQVP